MKKILTILIALLYTAITSGFTVNVHYCMGKLAAVKFIQSNSAACPKCGKKDGSNKCCRDEAKFFKMKELHQNVQLNVDLVNQLPVAILDTSFPSLLMPEIEIAERNPMARPNAPPLIKPTPLYLLHESFLI